MTILARAGTSGAYRWMWVAKPEFQIGNSLGTPGCFRKSGKYRTYGSDFRASAQGAPAPVGFGSLSRKSGCEKRVLQEYQNKEEYLWQSGDNGSWKNFLLARPKSAVGHCCVHER